MHLLVDDPLCLEHIFGQHILEIFANTALELPAATVAAGHARQALADIFAQRELLFVFVGDEGSGLAGRPRLFGKKREHGERSEEHTSELQSLMRLPYAVLCMKKKNT